MAGEAISTPGSSTPACYNLKPVDGGMPSLPLATPRANHHKNLECKKAILGAGKIAFLPTKDRGCKMPQFIPAKFFFAKASEKSRRSLGEGGPYHGLT